MTDTPRLRLPSSAATWENSGTDKGRAVNGGSTPDGPGRSAEEIDVGTSLPSAADVAQHPLDIERMSRVDGCPECVANTEPPCAWVSTTDGFRAAYLCGDCGHAWTTDWRD